MTTRRIVEFEIEFPFHNESKTVLISWDEFVIGKMGMELELIIELIIIFNG